MHRMDLVQADSFGNISKPRGPFIAKQSDRASGSVFSHCHKIEPAVVVIIYCGQTPAASPIELWQFRGNEFLAALISPKRKRGRAGMTECQIHPSVLVEIERQRTDGWSGHRRRPGLRRTKCALTRIEEDSWRII